MAITLVGTASGASDGGTTITVDLSTLGMVAGDVVYVCVGTAFGTPGIATTGYTNILAVTTSPANAVVVYRKVMGSTPDTAIVFNANVNGDVEGTAAIAVVLRGVVSPYEDVTPQSFAQDSASPIQPDSPAITTVTANAWSVIYGLIPYLHTGAITAPAGYSNLIQRGSFVQPPNTYAMSMAAATKQLGTPGVENPAAWAGFDVSYPPQVSPHQGITIAVRSQSPDVTMPAGKGTYLVTGKALTLLKTKIVAVTTGTYGVSGKTANYNYAPIIPPQVLGGGFFPWGSAPWGGTLTLAGFFTVALDKGTYTVSGQQATLRLDNVIIADKGTYTLVGKAALVRKTRVLVAEHGTYSVSGKPATFLFSKIIRADAGAYNVVGKAASLTYVSVGHYTIPAAPGTYAVAGKAAQLIKTRTLVAEHGTYSVVGKAATVVTAKMLTAEKGTYALSGQQAIIVKGRTLAAAPSSYAVSGKIASLLKSRLLSAEPSSYSVVGKAATITYQILGNYVISAAPGSYVVSGKAATITRGIRFLRADKGTYLISGKDASLNWSPVQPPPGRIYTPGWEWQAYDRAWDERRLV